MTSERGNVKITGMGTASGGDFGSVRITGEAMIQGEMRCERFACIGTCSVEGGLSAKRLRLLGEAALEGALTADDLRLTGRIEAKGGIRARTMVVRGEVSTEGDLETDRLNARGAFDIGGLLNAGQADIRLYGSSRAQDIGGGTISVRRRGFRALKPWFTGSGAPELVAQTIEGDDIYLEHTRADVVRGKRIELGPGCRIRRAEYTESLRTHKSAEVGEFRKEP
ncbi:hypothetical protein [Paenibacillus sp.]|uniref:hypothetical protein n=1 Tax=Paenibacillus sp. TaxID=58172 RepID=UPI002810A8D1|nr:hypothetical protein [Paenibacillus sp.]